MMRRLIWVILGASFLVGGCSLAARRARRSLDQTRVAHARELEVARRAPSAHQRFESALRRAAESDKKSAARGDYEALSRILLELGIAEAERAELAQRRLAEERTLITLDQRLVELERDRAATATQAELLAAQASARDEANRALARAALRPQLRVKLPRAEVQQAAEALIGRCELIALTLESLGASGPALARVRQQLADAKGLLGKEPDASLARADHCLFAALPLLATARAGATEPDPLERASLGEALASAGARTTRSDRGLTAIIEGAFVGSALGPLAERPLERLCALAQAHLHGPVQLIVAGKSEPLGSARAEVVRTHLGRAGCRGERFRVLTRVVGAREAGDVLEANFLAY